MSDDRDRRLDAIAALPLPDFLAAVWAMVSATQRPGEPLHIDRAARERIAARIAARDAANTQSLIASGLAARHRNATGPHAGYTGDNHEH